MESLYWYQAPTTDLRRAGIAAVLVDSKIWLSDPRPFRDPSELRPLFRMEGSLDEIQKYVDHLIKHYDRRRLSPAARLLERARLTRSIQLNPEGGAEDLHAILAGCGVLCLTDSHSQAHMWAHYANNHQGFCFEFDASCGLFVLAQVVRYVESYPIINRLRDSREVMLEKAMYTKHQSWAHEREWRVVARPHNERAKTILAERTVPQAMRDFYANEHGAGYYAFPRNALKSVTFGKDVSQADWNWIQPLIPRGTMQWSAYMSVGNFEVQRRPLEVDLEALIAQDDLQPRTHLLRRQMSLT